MCFTHFIRDEKTGHSKIIEEIPAPLIEYLVFEGGGVRGVAFGGAIEELARAKILNSVKHVAGSSIGGIAAMLLALGYDGEELKDILKNVRFRDFLEGEKPWPITPEFIIKGKQYLNVLTNEHHSVSPGMLFLEWLEKKVEKKLGNKHATFADLAKLTESQKEWHYKLLSITGSNLTKNRLEVFNHENTPNMPIALAVRISASFPGIFKAIEWDNGQGMCLYLDGGLMNNLPYFIFNKRKYLPKGYDFTDEAANPAVLNIKIDTAIEVAQILWNTSDNKVIRGIKEFTKTLIEGMQSRDLEIYEQMSTNTIQIFDNDIQEFDLSTREKNILINAGREAACEWLQTHVSEAYKINCFQNEEAWLAAKSFEEVVMIRNAYKDMFVNKEHDVLLLKKIFWLKKYLFYRLEKLLNPNFEANLDYTPHINLECKKPRLESDDCLKSNMENVLLFIEEQIALLEDKIKSEKKKIESHEINLLHDTAIYDMVIYTANLEERYKLFNQIKRDLQNKLNLVVPKAEESFGHANSCNNMHKLFDHEIKKMVKNNPSLITNHKFLIMMISAHLNNKNVSYPNEEDNMMVTLNLHNENDFRVYVMACMLYLKFVQSHDKLSKKINLIYQALFNNHVIPKNLYELGMVLKTEASDLLVHAYRIEKLIKNFIRIDRPKEKEKFSLLNIDHVFHAIADQKKKLKALMLRKFSMAEEDDDIELDFIYHPFCYQDKFSLFRHAETVNASHPSLSNSDYQAENEGSLSVK